MRTQIGRTVVAVDDLVIMRAIRKLLQLLQPEPREAVVNWIVSGHKSWPVTDRQGKVIDDTQPPLLGFIEQQQNSERAGDGASAAV